MLNWKKKRSCYITVYLNDQVFYYQFDHAVQFICRYINYKCKESKLLCFSCRWCFVPAGLLSKPWWELQAASITTIRLPQRRCRWHSEQQRISLLSPRAAARGQQRPGPGAVPPRRCGRVLPGTRAQRRARRRRRRRRQPELSPEQGNELAPGSTALRRAPLNEAWQGREEGNQSTRQAGHLKWKYRQPSSQPSADTPQHLPVALIPRILPGGYQNKHSRQINAPIWANILSPAGAVDKNDWQELTATDDLVFFWLHSEGYFLSCPAFQIIYIGLW